MSLQAYYTIVSLPCCCKLAISSDWLPSGGLSSVKLYRAGCCLPGGLLSVKLYRASCCPLMSIGLAIGRVTVLDTKMKSLA